MADRHVQRALILAESSLTAAADPADFISEDMIEEFTDAAIEAWAYGLNQVYGVVGELPTPIMRSTVNKAINDAVRSYDDLLRAVIQSKAFNQREPIFGEFIKGGIVQYGDVRPMLVTLGGGSPEGQVPMLGGIGSGTIMRDWLSSNGIESDKKIWLYGYEDEPRRTFNGHLQMDGLVFENWDDEGLEIAPQDAWLRRTHYQPGDHRGCACVVAPYIPNWGEDYEIDI